MKCNHCDYESEQEFKFCPLCGQAAPAASPVKNIVSEKFLTAMKDPLFLVVCILLTVSCGISLVSGSVNVISILMTVFIWLIYAASLKDTVDVNHMRNLSGTIYAEYVVNQVAYIILAVCGIIIGLALNLVTGNAELMEMIKDQLMYESKIVEVIINSITAISGWVIAAVILLASALGMVFNIIGLRKIHRLAKAAYQSVDAADLALAEKAQKANTWLWVFGVFAAVAALSSLLALEITGFLMNGSSAGAYIVAAMLVKKYVLTEDTQ